MDNKKKKTVSKPIKLKVLRQGNVTKKVLIGKNTSLSKLMKWYCDHAELNMQAVHFRFDGYPINEADSATSLDMEDGDIVEVHEQTGCVDYIGQISNKTVSKPIKLKVLRQGNVTKKVIIGKNTSLSKLMKWYCDHAQLNMQAVHFRFDGYPINEADSATSLDMEDGDIVEVHEQTGCVDYIGQISNKTVSEPINLKVLRQDNVVKQVIIEKNTPMSQMMKKYCDYEGLNMEAVRFRFDGYPINEADTVTSLDMEDGDIVEVHPPQSGCLDYICQISNKTVSQPINLKVLRQDNVTKQVIIGKNTSMSKLMKRYCDHAELNMQAVHFRFDGYPINEADSATSLDMEDGDIVEVHEQTGCVDYIGQISNKTESERISLMVLRQDNVVKQALIWKNTPMSKLMQTYCDYEGLNMQAVHFHFDGYPINETDTATSLNMKEGDIVKVHLIQT